MHALRACLLSGLCIAAASAKYLVSYNASAGDDPSVLGQLNLGGRERADWPSGQGQNSSVYFKTATDPDGVQAAHVHKNTDFTRAEYHMLKDEIAADTTYYIGYKVRYDSVDYQTFVWQWKNYDSATVGVDNVPAVLTFAKDADDSNYHTITLKANPSAKDGGATVVWSKALTMGRTYAFGLVVNTSQTGGFLQLYFDGALATLTDASGTKTQKLAGNFFPGGSGASSSPKVGLYGSGIGKACSLAFAKNGAQELLVADLNVEADKKTVTEATAVATNPNFIAEAFELDVTLEESVEAAVGYATTFLGRIDYCVHSAGVPGGTFDPIAETSFADFKRLLEVNVQGTFLVTRLVSAAMKSQGPKQVDVSNPKRSVSRGTIVIMASVSYVISVPSMVQYTTSKHCYPRKHKDCRLISFDPAAIDNVPNNIRVNCVCPSWTDTPMTQTAMELSQGSNRQCWLEF
ncbi:Uu.00g042860.m01.CDS01 [Anthostomella pinea]|uniref:Uu.00g042860.m01.CDS01 n=1 Tax=Anthostomella pinea TaxID=933095 RepID=A0AAI8VAS6_9PEZI|nr:Uu.00g042860.m01.CDS01 [Anthostomella pinea]